MRRSPTLLAVVAVALLAPALAACEPTDGAKNTSAEPERIPFESGASDGTDDTEPLSGDGSSTRKTEPEPEDTGSDEDTNVIEVDVTAADTEPDTVVDTVKDTTPDTRSKNDPLCKAAKKVVTLNSEIQYVLNKALKATTTTGLSKWLKKLPLDRTKNAYDDLAAEVETTAMRRRVAIIRDFTIKETTKLSEVKDLDELNQFVIDLESDPDASASTKATLKVSAYTEKECGIRIAQGADTSG